MSETAINEFPEMPTLRCKGCGEQKKLMFFNKSNRSRDGKQGTCRVCLADDNQRRVAGNPVPSATLGDWHARMANRSKRRLVR